MKYYNIKDGKIEKGTKSDNPEYNYVISNDEVTITDFDKGNAIPLYKYVLNYQNLLYWKRLRIYLIVGVCILIAFSMFYNIKNYFKIKDIELTLSEVTKTQVIYDEKNQSNHEKTIKKLNKFIDYFEKVNESLINKNLNHEGK